jgi:type I restriction enzyme S subunit
MKTNIQTKKIEEICRIVNGGTPDTKNSKYWDGDNFWVTPKDLGQMEGLYIEETLRKISDLGLRNSSAKLLPIGSLILSTRAPIGYVAINEKEMATNQGCKGLIPSEIINVKYLYYFLKNSTDLLNNLGSGTTFKELSGTKLAGISLPVPSLSEQRRIVKILDETFEEIEKTKKNIEKNLQNSKELFESYLNNIYCSFHPSWETKTLSQVYDVRDGTHDSPKYQKVGYALITSKNLKNGLLDYKSIKYISEKDYEKINDRSKVDKGDVLFAMIGTIGNPVVVDIEPNFAIKNVALFKVPKEQNSYFLKYFLDTKAVIDKMAKDAKGTTQKFVGLGYLRNFEIKIPKMLEQDVIVSKLDSLSSQTKKLEQIYTKKLLDLEELKKSILKRAFNGEL